MKDWRTEDQHLECPSCHGEDVMVGGGSGVGLLDKWHELFECAICHFSWIGHIPWTRNEKQAEEAENG